MPRGGTNPAPVYLSVGAFFAGDKESRSVVFCSATVLRYHDLRAYLALHFGGNLGLTTALFVEEDRRLAISQPLAHARITAARPSHGARVALDSVARVGLGARKTRAPRRVSTVARAGKTGAGDDDNADDAAGGKFMGRRGTYRKEVEDDAETAAARSSVKQQGGFGKPVTAKETWQPFQRPRAGLLEAAEGERTGSGDSATSSSRRCTSAWRTTRVQRTAVCLPIAAYVKRVDKLMDEFTARELPALVESKGGAALTTPEIIEALETHLFVTNKYCAPKGWRELYSPYRTYFHNVVAQEKVGIPATLAALYIPMRQTGPRQGRHPRRACDVDRPKPGTGWRASCRARRAVGRPSGATRPANSVVCTHNMALKLQLAALKRAPTVAPSAAPAGDDLAELTRVPCLRWRPRRGRTAQGVYLGDAAVG